MTQPATGTDWKPGGFGDTDNRFLERGGKIAVLVRQARGTATDISPHNSNGSVKFSPLAQNGQLRDDLFGWRRTNGIWAPVEDDNEGFHLLGAFKEGDGPTTKTDFNDDDYMIEQSNFPYDTDRVKEDEPFTLTPVDTLRPVLRRIRYGLPLADEDGNNLVEYPGQPNTGYGRPVEYTPRNYQFLLMREFNKPEGVVRTIKGYALCKNNNIGDAKMGKKEAEAAPLTMKPIPDGIMMAVIDGEYQPVLMFEWIGGPGYDAMYGSPVSQYLVTLGAQSSGTFTLTHSETADDTATIAYNAANSTVKTALVGIDDGFTAADWTVAGSAGGPYTVTTPPGVVLAGDGSSLGTPGNFSVTPITS